MPSKAMYAVGGIAALALLSNRGSANTTTAVQGQQNTLEITSTGSRSDYFSRNYSVTVTGGIRPLTDTEPGDSLSDRSANGQLTAGTDTYVFTGEIEHLGLPSGLEATVNGVPV